MKSASSLNAPFLIGALVVLLFALVFVLPWWNRYLGITNEGWYQFFGKQILEGRIPYRDFYLFVPPAQPLTMAALTSVFGNRVVVPELFGFAGAVLLAIALYVWLSRLFPLFWVTVAVVCANAVYLRQPTESLSGLHLNANLYPVLGLLAASFALDRTEGSGRLLILAGFLAGASFMTKQTGGVAITGALGLVLPGVIAARSGARAGLRAGGLVAIGWGVPILLVSVWLARHGAFGDFFLDVFLRGPSSKGSIPSLLARQVEAIVDSRHLEASASSACVLVLLATLLFHFMPAARDETRVFSKKREILSIGAFGAIAIGLTACAQHWPGALPSKLDRVYSLCEDTLIYLGELGSLALLAVFGWRLLRGKLNWRGEQLLLAAGTSFVCAFLFSLSWANARIMLIPACPLVLAFGLSRLPAGRMTFAVKTLAVVAVSVCVTFAAGSKMRQPYRWADWQEGNALRATLATDFPELRGIRVTPETGAFLRRVVNDIQQYSRPTDPVAEFPTMPILYLLAHRKPATFAYVHYIDVTPDYIYTRDAQTLEHSPPAVIVFLNRSGAELKDDEISFRNGQRSGERTLWETIRKLSGDYRIVDVLQTPNTNQRFEVWARRQ